MKKIVIVCLCAALLLALPFTSLAAEPKPFVSKNRIGVPTPDNGDPDGPTNGFLDDPTDWKYLIKLIIFDILLVGDVYGMVYAFPDLPIDPDEIPGYIQNLTDFGKATLLYLCMSVGIDGMSVYACMFEAFDIMDLDKDGC